MKKAEFELPHMILSNLRLDDLSSLNGMALDRSPREPLSYL